MSGFYKMVGNISIFSAITTSCFGFHYKWGFCFDYVHIINTVEKSAAYYITVANDQNFLYYRVIHFLLNKKFTLPIFAILVLSTFLAYYFQNNFPTVSATSSSPKDQLMPFDIKNLFDAGPAQNETADNSSNIVADDNQESLTDCEMPPCPPGQACIQSCP